MLLLFFFFFWGGEVGELGPREWFKNIPAHLIFKGVALPLVHKGIHGQWRNREIFLGQSLFPIFSRREVNFPDFFLA